MAAEQLEWDDAVGLGIAALALILFIIALKGYLRTRTPRVLLFAAAFGVLFVKGVVKVLEVLVIGDHPMVDVLELMCDAAALLLFFFGMVKA